MTRAMPPRESSRSRTYLPKTCGYKAQGVQGIKKPIRTSEWYQERADRSLSDVHCTHRTMRAAHRRKDTGLAFALGVMALGAGCSRDPDIVERPVYVYSPRACPVAQSDAFSVLYASGD